MRRLVTVRRRIALVGSRFLAAITRATRLPHVERAVMHPDGEDGRRPFNTDERPAVFAGGMTAHRENTMEPVQKSEQQWMPAPGKPRLRAAALLQGHREVIIEHGNEEYRLRLTRQGKLLLTK